MCFKKDTKLRFPDLTRVSQGKKWCCESLSIQIFIWVAWHRCRIPRAYCSVATNACQWHVVTSFVLSAQHYSTPARRVSMPCNNLLHEFACCGNQNQKSCTKQLVKHWFKTRKTSLTLTPYSSGRRNLRRERFVWLRRSTRAIVGSTCQIGNIYVNDRLHLRCHSTITAWVAVKWVTVLYKDAHLRHVAVDPVQDVQATVRPEEEPERVQQYIWLARRVGHTTSN